ncbi:hypothetical protein [Methanotorris formicicus]|uniref:Uncharacterized protein n=1 Tax=Methanotorris formicicus Mc-S-70 TaxID=647171 RepID=H1KWP9_9EURY|nr:hypothetical protein [Methanotorris formicicus]EHP89164.1 hypothetical protein MetfoDRAFT_0222 [Methanotorris formicicus Mc-S-70]
MKSLSLVLLLCILGSLMHVFAEDYKDVPPIVPDESELKPVDPNKKFGDEGISPIVIGGIVVVILVGGYFGYRYLKNR